MRLNHIDKGNAFDWGKASNDYAKYRDIYPDIFYRKIVDLGLCTKGQSVLDLGTGTGVLPRNLHPYGASFVGIDISENQIKQARQLSEKANMNITYLVMSAEELRFPEKQFDVVTACQCFMYFDKSVVLPKVHTLLKDGGYFCILFMAWLPGESKIAKASEKLVLQYNPAWTGGNMQRYALKTPDWSKELFDVADAQTFDINVAFTRESWNGRIKACRGIGASSLTADEIAAFEQEHMHYLHTQPEQFEIPHYATILNLQKKI